MRKYLALPCLWLVVTGFACSENLPDPSKPMVGRPGISEVALPADDTIVQGQTLYAPVYSHVLTADSANSLNLASTLFVRNIDPDRPIILTRVDYFDSGGKSLRSFVKSPLKIDPLASVNFFVKESDETGGASPSFLVEWVATAAVANPLAETVMIATTGSQGISFTCQARVSRSRKP